MTAGNPFARRAAKRPRRPRPAPRPAPRPIDDIALPAGPRVICHFPPVACSPNHRDRWGRIAAAKAYRKACWADARAARIKAPAEGFIRLRLDFFPPDRRARDDDNAIAAFKAGRDGIADALGVDDRRFRITTVWHDEPRACVVATIIEGGDA